MTAPAVLDRVCDGKHKCKEPAVVLLVALTAEGEWVWLVDAAGRRVRSCAAHVMGLMARHGVGLEPLGVQKIRTVELYAAAMSTDATPTPVEDEGAAPALPGPEAEPAEQDAD